VDGIVEQIMGAKPGVERRFASIPDSQPPRRWILCWELAFVKVRQTCAALHDPDCIHDLVSLDVFQRVRELARDIETLDWGLTQGAGSGLSLNNGA
jgi:hypothetical protein